MNKKKSFKIFQLKKRHFPTDRVEVTSAAFGGETLQDLYLTTAREDFDEANLKEFP